MRYGTTILLKNLHYIIRDYFFWNNFPNIQTGGIDVTDRDFLKSLVLFLIYDVPENTRESSLQLYQRWQKNTGIIVRHPDRAVWTLEYLERMKHYRRGALEEAAVIDGFISRGQLSARQNDED